MYVYLLQEIEEGLGVLKTVAGKVGLFIGQIQILFRHNTQILSRHNTNTSKTSCRHHNSIKQLCA